MRHGISAIAARLILALMTIGWLARAGGAQYDPPPLVPVGVTPNTVLRSQCWFWLESYTAMHNIQAWPEDVSRGFPLHIDLNFDMVVQQPTFLPRTADPIEGSSPLISAEVARAAVPSAWGSRPVLGGVLDLITMRPLVQEVDLDLPFGSAHFRHVRTYGEKPEFMRRYFITQDMSVGQDIGAFWDWNGHRWMMGENPILLLDFAVLRAALPDAPRRIYLVPDAHRSIPFDFVEADGSYVAPPRFDAKLRHNGVWDVVGKTWTYEPDEFSIHLHSSSLRYDFRAVVDPIAGRDADIRRLRVPNIAPPPPDVPVSAHVPPKLSEPYNPAHDHALGAPRYALLTRMEDRAGHRIDIEYATGTFGPQAMFVVTSPVTPVPPAGFVPVAQRCNEKGQIKNVKLRVREAGEYETIWTLLYTHRSFEPDVPLLWMPIETPSQIRALTLPNVLHSIHAYPGDVDDSARTRPTLDAALFVATYPGSAVDQLNTIDAISAADSMRAPETRVPDNWLHEVRYMYSEFIFAGPLHITALQRSANRSPTENRDGPYLIKATTRSRATTTDPVVPTKRLYRYAATIDDGAPADGDRFSLLTGIYTPGTVGKLLNAARLISGPPLRSVSALIDLEHGTTVEIPEESTRLMLDWADVTFDRVTDAGGFETSQHAQQMVIDMALPPAHLDGLMRLTNSVGRLHVSAGPASGTYRTYLFFLDESFTTPLNGKYCHPPWREDAAKFQPAALLDPFPRTAIDEPGGIYTSGTAAQLDRVRWIAVVDRFEDRESARDQDLSLATPPGLLTRRILRMNAAGFVLRERTTDKQTGGVSASGLGEDYIYEAAAPYRLTERRTAGWSAVPAAQQVSPLR